MDILKYKTIVIKIGSSLIVDGKNKIKKAPLAMGTQNPIKGQRWLRVFLKKRVYYIIRFVIGRLSVRKTQKCSSGIGALPKVVKLTDTLKLKVSA